MTDVAVFVSCDQCNARAYIHVQLTGGGTLAYCAHHGHQHTPALQAAGATVLDLTHMLEG
ncbi:hypothetical protein [Microbacterium sp. 5K110]|jgi:hypothetical protein|uniref:DUF7455 domain-containing protein n=1 Tax=Microbacterium sp. 5K110 TaxID=2578104 RepID=UPI0010FD9FF3|nr:hypothetical protein [Microbacterium sp. 5K110]TLF33245.1 hypothetical protein FE256_03890 [Microbacterium sp. 5K110]